MRTVFIHNRELIRYKFWRFALLCDTTGKRRLVWMKYL
jgi:hypothetical protein